MGSKSRKEEVYLAIRQGRSVRNIKIKMTKSRFIKLRRTELSKILTEAYMQGKNNVSERNFYEWLQEQLK